MHLYVSICKPAFGGKWPEEKLQLEEDSTKHPTIVDSLYPEPWTL